ncbi:MAG: hypothetical protein EXS55_04900 [Candidatus Magasanikbacteria bacterium]|nr:hypothetical protein [Candidatus Magasanikbacteria bacterium]
MRIFLIIWAGEERGLNQVALELQKRSHEIVYWSGYKIHESVPTSLFPSTVFHEYFDALSGIPAHGIDTAKFDPPGEDLLKHFFENESVLLTMMNKKYEGMGVSERKHLYYHFLQYWYGVVKRLKPDIIIFPITPHSVYDYVLYSVAKFLKVKTVLFEYTRVHDRLLVMNDFTVGSTHLAATLEANRAKNFTLSELDQDVQAHYRLQTDATADATTLDVKQLVAQFSGAKLVKIKAKAILRSVTDTATLKKLFAYPFKRWKPNLNKEHLAVQRKADFAQKFVYVPLHFQPECSTSPMGGAFADQLLMIEILSAALPPDWEIYVKEHPVQWGPRGYNYSEYRYKGFYQALGKIKSVRLVPLDTDRYALINQAQAVSTVSGTAGWEAILRLKPVLVFGYAWYRHCPGVYKVDSAVTCREMFKKIEAGFRVTEQSVLNYLGSFNSASVHGYLDEYWKGISTISRTENINNILNALLLEIEQS